MVITEQSSDPLNQWPSDHGQPDKLGSFKLQFVARQHEGHDLTLLDVLVLLLHLLAHRPGQSLHDGAHDAEVGHVVDVALIRLRGDGVQLVLVCVLHTWTWTIADSIFRGCDIRHTHRCVCVCVCAFTLTNGKQLDAGVPQALSRRNDIVLGLPVRDEDPDLGHSGP